LPALLLALKPIFEGSALISTVLGPDRGTPASIPGRFRDAAGGAPRAKEGTRLMDNKDDEQKPGAARKPSRAEELRQAHEEHAKKQRELLKRLRRLLDGMSSPTRRG